MTPLADLNLNTSFHFDGLKGLISLNNRVIDSLISGTFNRYYECIGELWETIFGVMPFISCVIVNIKARIS